MKVVVTEVTDDCSRKYWVKKHSSNSLCLNVKNMKINHKNLLVQIKCSFWLWVGSRMICTGELPCFEVSFSTGHALENQTNRFTSDCLVTLCIIRLN